MFNCRESQAKTEASFQAKSQVNRSPGQEGVPRQEGALGAQVAVPVDAEGRRVQGGGPTQFITGNASALYAGVSEIAQY